MGQDAITPASQQEVDAFLKDTNVFIKDNVDLGKIQQNMGQRIKVYVGRNQLTANKFKPRPKLEA